MVTTLTLLGEAFVAGIITAIYSVIITLVLEALKVQQHLILQVFIITFLTGFSLHIFSHYTGLVTETCENRKDEICDKK